MIQSAACDIIKQEGIQEGWVQGLEKGLEQGIAFGLDVRFGNQGLRLLPEISRIADLVMLRAVMERLKTVPTTEELRDLYLPA